MRVVATWVGAAAALAGGPVSARPAAPREAAFVANAENGTVSLVDVAAHKVVGSIDINPERRTIDRPGAPPTTPPWSAPRRCR